MIPLFLSTKIKTYVMPKMTDGIQQASPANIFLILLKRIAPITVKSPMIMGASMIPVEDNRHALRFAIPYNSQE